MVQTIKTGTQVAQEFVPPYPATIADTGLKEGFLEELILKDVYMVNFALGREIASRTCLPFKIVEEVLEVLKRQLLVEVRSSGGLADYEYTPTEKGRDRAAKAECEFFVPGSSPRRAGSAAESGWCRRRAGWKSTRETGQPLAVCRRGPDTRVP